MSHRLIKFELPDIPPAKKNSKRMLGGKLLPSQRFYDWQEMAIASLHWNKEYQLGFVRRVEVRLYSKLGRRFDGDNALTSVLDMLVEAGVLEDDRVQVIPDVRVRWFETPFDRAKTEIRLYDCSFNRKGGRKYDESVAR